MTIEVEERKVEVADPSKEKGKETAPKDIPTVDVTKTPEFKKALDSAVGKSMASLNAKVTISNQATQAAEAQVTVMEATHTKTLSDIEFLEGKIENLASEKFTDDPDAAKGYRNTLAIELRERKAKAREEAVGLREAEQEKRVLFYQLGEKALELKKEYDVPEGILESCSTVKQMETIAKVFPKAGEKKEPEEDKFDSGKNSGGGVDWRKLSPQAKIQYGIDHKKN